MNTKPDAKFKTDAGVESKFANMSSDNHALKEAFGNDEQAKKIEVDASVIAPNIADLYDDPAAGIREYLSNAETACIRRARETVKEAGRDPSKDVDEMLEQAKDEGYDPLVEVTYNRKSEATRLVIDDNGIGISTDEYLVLKNLGYSTSHDEGTQLGNFGMGYMSGFQLSGVHGVFKMYTRSYTTGKAFSTANYIVNFEYLDGLREDYGTRFEFPAFCEKAGRIDVPEKVAHYAQGMRVPVLYRDFNEDGKETPRSDDFIPSNLADDYDGFFVKVENEFFEAVMAPGAHRTRGTGRTQSVVTYNISMPIRRNIDSYSAGSATWKFDFRGKTERGEIVHCPSNPDLVGLKPVPRQESDDESHIAEQDVPEDAIRHPEPASSRDSYESGNDAFWNYVAHCLDEAWREMAADAVGKVNTFDDVLGVDDSSLLITALSNFSIEYQGPDRFQQGIEDNLGISLSDDFCEKYIESGKSVLLVREGSPRPSIKNSAGYKNIRDILAMGGDVYIGQTISHRKAQIVWELGGHVVQCDTSEYEELQDKWGWNLIKDVKTSNLAENYPDLSDDFVDMWDDVDKTKTSQPKSKTHDRNAEHKCVSVRKGEGRDYVNSNYTAKDIKERLEAGEDLYCSSWSAENRSKLLIFRQQKGVTVSDIVRHAGGDVAVAKVPKYVYDYLEGTTNVYTSVDELRQEQARNSYIKLSDGYTARLDNLTNSDVLFFASAEIEDYFEGREDDLLEQIDADADRLTFVKQSDFEDTNLLTIKAQLLSTVSTNLPHSVWRTNVDMAAIKREELFPNLDWEHPVIKMIFETKYHSFKNDKDDLEKLHDFFDEVGAELPTVEESE